MISIQCAICGKGEKLRVLYKDNASLKKISKNTFSARRTPDRMHYRFVQCDNCGLIFSNPIFSKKMIVDLYKRSNFTYNTESLYLRKTYGDYLEYILKDNKSDKLNLLDIGCGNGFFLEEAIKRGVHNVFGLEPGSASVAKAPKWLRENIKIGILKKGVFRENTFDVICCFHTLDHIVDLNDFLQTLYAILKKKGKAIIIVHDTSGLSVKLFGEKSPIFDIEHIFLFNKKNLTQVFQKNKFRVVQTFDVTNSYPLDYWLRMSPIPIVIKKSLSKSLRFLRLGKIPFSLKAGNIGIIVQK